MPKDERPLVSDGPEWFTALMEEFSPRVEALYEEFWTRAVENAASNPDRSDGENQALSVFAQLAGFPILRMATKLAETKKCDDFTALMVALQDVKHRIMRSTAAAIIDHVAENLRTDDAKETAE